MYLRFFVSVFVGFDIMSAWLQERKKENRWPLATMVYHAFTPLTGIYLSLVLLIRNRCIGSICHSLAYARRQGKALTCVLTHTQIDRQIHTHTHVHKLTNKQTNSPSNQYEPHLLWFSIWRRQDNRCSLSTTDCKVFSWKAFDDLHFSPKKTSHRRVFGVFLCPT